MSPEISCFREPLKAAIWLREQTHSVCYAVFPGRSSGEIRPVNPALWQHCTIPRHTRQLLRLRRGGFFALAARFSFAHFHVQYASGSLYPAYPAARTQAAGGYFRTQQGFPAIASPWRRRQTAGVSNEVFVATGRARLCTFALSISCKSLISANRRNLQESLTQNPLAGRPSHLCGIALTDITIRKSSHDSACRFGTLA